MASLLYANWDMTWMALRSFGQCPMYPQYPILNYFIDFGNPFLKVGIECGGYMFHLDKEKDLKRDTNLKNEGWDIFRISGKHCYKHPSEEYYDIEYANEYDRYGIMKDYYLNTIEGLVNAIAIFYCEYDVFNQDYSEIDLAYECL